MIGTCYELTLYFTFDNTIRNTIGASRKYFLHLRKRAYTHTINKDDMYEFLTKVGCVMIRPDVIIPATFENENGSVCDERSLLIKHKARLTELGIRISIDEVMDGCLPSESDVAKLAKKYRYKCINNRQLLPSVWSYEPIVPDWIPEYTKSISRIIGCPVLQEL